jgi:hypothetical protein
LPQITGSEKTQHLLREAHGHDSKLEVDYQITGGILMKIFSALFLLAVLNAFPALSVAHAEDDVSRDPANETQQTTTPQNDQVRENPPQNETTNAKPQETPAENTENR